MLTHQSPCSSYSSLAPVDPVNNFPRVRGSAIDLPFLQSPPWHNKHYNNRICVVGKVGHSLDRLGGRRISEVWIDRPALVAAWIEVCPGSIGGGRVSGQARVSPNHPRPDITPPQHRITTHYIECDKDPGMYRTRTRVPSMLLFR